MLSSDRVRWSERRRLRGCSGGDFWLCCAGWKWAGVTLMITFTTAQSLLWHLCETRGCSAALHQLQPLSCLICCQKTFATHQIHFFPPTMCRWMTYSSYKQTSINTRFLCLIFDLCFYHCLRKAEVAVKVDGTSKDCKLSFPSEFTPLTWQILWKLCKLL